MDRPEEPGTLGPRGALFLAALLIVALQRFVPYGQLVLYPFTLLSTWVHEMGHGLTAVLLGGRFERLDIFADASGMAHSAVVPGVRQALVAAGGLIGPPLGGALILAMAGALRGRLVRPTLYAFGIALLLSLFLFVRTTVGWLTVGGLSAVFLLVGRTAGPGLARFFAQLVGLLLALDTVARADYLFMKSARVGGAMRPSDVAAIAQVMGGPTAFWGGLLAAVSVVLLGFGLWMVLRGRSEPLERRG